MPWPVDDKGRYTQERKTTPETWYEHYQEQIAPGISHAELTWKNEKGDILDDFKMDKETLETIKTDDVELLKLAYWWVKKELFGMK